jgi:hypothetical protein
MEKMNVADVEYCVFNGSPSDGVPRNIYDAVKYFWETEWNGVFQKIDSTFVVDADDFQKQTRVTAIMYRGDVLGMQTLCDHRIEDVLTHPYFKPYTKEFIHGLIDHRLKEFQVMQYFLINEKYGVRQTGLNLPAILLGLNFKQQLHYGLPATVGLARKDVASASTAAKFNMKQVGPDIEMHNVPVGQMLCLQPARHPKTEVAETIEMLWERRVDYTQTVPVFEAPMGRNELTI